MKIKLIEYSHTGAPADLAHSLLEEGMACVVGHTLDPKLLDKVLGVWGAFFQSPDRKKHQTSHGGSGYNFQEGEESYLYLPQSRHPQGTTAVTKDLFEEGDRLARRFFSWIESELPKGVLSTIKAALSQSERMFQEPFLRISFQEGGRRKLRRKAEECLLQMTFLANDPKVCFFGQGDAGPVSLALPSYGLLVGVGGSLDKLSGGFYTAASCCEHLDLSDGEKGCLVSFYLTPHL